MASGARRQLWGVGPGQRKKPGSEKQGMAHTHQQQQQQPKKKKKARKKTLRNLLVMVTREDGAAERASTGLVCLGEREVLLGLVRGLAGFRGARATTCGGDADLGKAGSVQRASTLREGVRWALLRVPRPGCVAFEV